MLLTTYAAPPPRRKVTLVSRPASVRRGLAAAVLVPLALASVTACGDRSATATDGSAASTASGSADASASASAASSAAASPSRSSASSTDGLTPGQSVDPADFTRTFEAGFAHTTTAHEKLTMSLGASTLKGEGDVDYTSSSPSMTMSLDSGAGGAIDMRLAGGVIYMQIPGMSDGKFLKMDLSDPNSPLGSLGTQLDPQEALKSFGKGIRSVTFVGHEGSLDHYRVTVDTKKMLAQMDQGGAAAAASGMPDELSYDVRLDDQGRVNRMKIDLGATGTMEMTLSDFGKDVHVEVPPAGQVTEMPAMPGTDG